MVGFAFTSNAFLFLAEDSHIRSPKTIDGLFPVTHDKELIISSCQQIYQLALPGICILVLIHKQGLDLPLPVC